MTIASTRQVGVQYTGDLRVGVSLPEVINSNSPAKFDIVDLVPGNNSITVPTQGDTIPSSVTIVPPADNIVALTIRGVTTDTGINLHPTDPSVIAIATTVGTIVLAAGSTIAGARLYWA